MKAFSPVSNQAIWDGGGELGSFETPCTGRLLPFPELVSVFSSPLGTGWGGRAAYMANKLDANSCEAKTEAKKPL